MKFKLLPSEINSIESLIKKLFISRTFKINKTDVFACWVYIIINPLRTGLEEFIKVVNQVDCYKKSAYTVEKYIELYMWSDFHSYYNMKNVSFYLEGFLKKYPDFKPDFIKHDSCAIDYNNFLISLPSLPHDMVNLERELRKIKNSEIYIKEIQKMVEISDMLEKKLRELSLSLCDKYDIPIAPIFFSNSFIEDNGF